MNVHLSSEVLSGWLEQDLSSDQRYTASEHLQLCPRCRAELLSLRRWVKLAGEPPAAWAGKSEVWDSIAARLRSGPFVTSRAAGFPKREIVVLVAAAAVVAALLLVPRASERSREPSRVAMEELLALDRQVSREVEALAMRPEWGTPAARRTLLAANREISGGIEDLTRSLRERPGDPALTELLGRAIEHRARVMAEAVQ